MNARFKDEFLQTFSQHLNRADFILGKSVEDFECNFAKYIQYDEKLYGIGVASGLDSLILSLKALDLRENDEVIVPANTYIATILAILHNNLKPVLVDPDLSTYNITLEKIKQRTTKNTKAIIIVHLYGKPCDSLEIMQFCNENNIALIEDCAQSHGSYIIENKNIRKTGSFGIMSCFSFYPSKNLGALGDGGMIMTKDEKLANKLRALRNYGSSAKYHNDYIGLNSRLDSIQAAFLNIKLKYLDEMLQHKRHLAKIYLHTLKDDFIKPVVNEKYYDTYHIFNIRHEKRDEIIKYLLNHNIKTQVHYPIAPYNQKALRDMFDKNSFRNSDEIHATTLSLPISFAHTIEEIEKVAFILNRF